MKYKRSAGILLHPTSLPGPFGIGDLGGEAYKFIDFLCDAGQSLWQILPMGPTGYGDSPYQSFSAFAGNPLLISPKTLFEEGFISKEDLKNHPHFNPIKIDYGQSVNYKYNLFSKAFETNKKQNQIHGDEYLNFCNENEYWLDDFAFFMACKKAHNGVHWKEWDKQIAFRNPEAVDEWKAKLKDDVEFQKFIQFHFFKQWHKLKEYANSRNIKIIGDIPIFIAYDSADTWAKKELFTVDNEGKLETVAGVPPDYFSSTGQLWGNPLFRWDRMEADDFLWWRKRIEQMLKLVDFIRIDHFRGFEAFYEITGGSKTAQHGKWVKAPGEKLFNTIIEKLGDVPILAEDLGIITKEVKELREKYNFPGMRILQFAFGKDGDKRFLPHNYDVNTVVYTGSHDNDTTRGFFEKEKAKNSDVYTSAKKYLNYDGDDIRFELIRAAYASVANLVVIPMQDILNLGSEARMNYPGKQDGNWTWRFQWEQLDSELAGKYRTLSEIYYKGEKSDK